MLIRFLIWLGLTRRLVSGKLFIPFSAPPRWMYRDRCAGLRALWSIEPGFYIFRNLPGIIKWREGRLLPVRWGFGICGFEFGDRG